MATLPPSNIPSLLPSLPGIAPALVIDANVTIALTARESGRDVLVSTELNAYSSRGYKWYAPGVIVTETPYVLCQKHQAGVLTSDEYDDAASEFEILMQSILPPPQGEAALILRAHALSRGYGCSRSADGVYLALAEQLTLTRPTILLTFDQGVVKQAANHSPTVTCHLLV